MHAIDVVDVIEERVIPCARHYSNAASSIRAATGEDIVVRLIDVVGDKEKQGVSIIREYTDGDVKKIVEI